MVKGGVASWTAVARVMGWDRPLLRWKWSAARCSCSWNAESSYLSETAGLARGVWVESLGEQEVTNLVQRHKGRASGHICRLGSPVNSTLRVRLEQTILDLRPVPVRGGAS